MFIEDFIEKATGLATKWDLWHKRHDRRDTRKEEKSLGAHDKIRRKRPCVSDFSGRVKFSSSVLSRIQRSSEFVEDLIEARANPIVGGEWRMGIRISRRKAVFAVLTILSVNTIHHPIQFINYL